MKRALLRIAVSICLSGLAGSAWAATPTVVASFPATSGLGPYGALHRDAAGVVYGTTVYGGRRGGFGTIYRIDGGRFSAHFSFDRRHGIYPEAGVTPGSDGNLYGTTRGVVFSLARDPQHPPTLYRIDPNGVQKTLHAFDATSEGEPDGELAEGAPGVLYGAARRWNGFKSIWSVYRITSRGSFRMLREFTSAPQLSRGPDARVFGTTTTGGAGNLGMVFRIDPDGSVIELHSFDQTANLPFGLLAMDQDGNLVGATKTGGAQGCGTIFGLSVEGQRKLIHSQRCENGSAPPSVVAGEPGAFYGMTRVTDAPDRWRYPVIRYTLDGQASIVHAFRADSRHTPRMGFPTGELAFGADGNLYGTTRSDLEPDSWLKPGSVFKLTPGGVLSVVQRLYAPRGARPFGAIAPAHDGIYGTTLSGGIGVVGVAYHSGAEGLVSLHAMTGADAAYPYGLVAGPGDEFYGVDFGNGRGGSLFKIDGMGVFTPLQVIPGTSSRTLMRASDGNFYGVSPFGIFRFTPAGEFTWLTLEYRDFGLSPLVEGEPGSLYGIVRDGSPGRICRVTFAGDVAVIGTLGGAEGSYPSDGLIATPDGTLFGTTLSGGAEGNGTLYRRSADGTITVLHSFGVESGSRKGLLMGQDGKLYGYTSGNVFGEVTRRGTLFSMSVDGNFTALHSFDGPDGAYPAALVQAADGTFWGTTDAGGASGLGVIYRFAAP
jgi:uncharacterized repeat protein (TIGR03803 family)